MVLLTSSSVGGLQASLGWGHTPPASAPSSHDFTLCVSLCVSPRLTGMPVVGDGTHPNPIWPRLDSFSS